MTEAEWLDCTDPVPMLRSLRGKASERKLRLLACACCREVWERLWDRRLREAVETCERFADRLDHQAALAKARRLAAAALEEIRSDASEQRWYYVQELAAEVVHNSCRGKLSFNLLLEVIATATDCSFLAAGGDESEVIPAQADQAKAGLVRDLFGNPFRPARLDPAWAVWDGGTVAKLARAIYEEWAFDRLPVLADALEEAGCSNADILGHCRGAGPHVRGCWVLDLLLGKQ